tara:strand:+ start:112 stop:570 length:459 start_codon:yes stop_codon:yes gene_type:complete
MAFKMKGSAFKQGGIQGTSGYASALKDRETPIQMKSPLEQDLTNQQLISESVREDLANQNIEKYGVPIIKINETINPETNEPFTREEVASWRKEQTTEWQNLADNYKRGIAEAEKDQVRREELHRTKDTDLESKMIIDKSMGYDEKGNYIGN